MKNFIKGSMVAAAMLMGTSAFAQIADENNVTVTMELVPVLQLNMNTTDQVNFVFDEIPEYIGGITKYGATILTVSSTVNWDLFASGTSGTHNQNPLNRQWDFVVGYGPSTAVTTGAGSREVLPLTALELRQFPSTTAGGLLNNGTGTGQVYYTSAFSAALGTATTFPNNIYVTSGVSPYTPPAATTAPYIAGGFELTRYVNGGTYLTQTGSVGNTNYYFVIDYRIVPGLPAIFPKAGTTVGGADTPHNLASVNAFSTLADVGATGAYAKPGVYTMNVKYLLIENQ
jgi:hypothetical protein